MGNKLKVLVLGAGASVAFGYPVGSQLRQRLFDLIASRDRERFVITAGLSEDLHALESFVDAFRRSQMMSIDAFLARRPEFSDIGKRAIAALLLEVEMPPRLYLTDHHDNWYQYLLNSIATESWDDLNFSKLAIITFNYDRSLEHYLLSALGSAYGKNQEQVVEKLGSLEIVHIYGSLGDSLPGTKGYLEYGGAFGSEKVAIAAESIKVIPEGRDDGHTLKRSQSLLWNANAIAFLGFGFDPTNLKRLDAARSCSEIYKRENESGSRTVAATCLGLTDAEIADAARSTGQDLNNPVSVRSRFMDCDCLQLLRRTLILKS